MNVLVTAGDTHVPIDRVRYITNIFSGRTGAAIALEAHHRGHSVTLLTSHPGALPGPADTQRWRCIGYRTFNDLLSAMVAGIVSDRPDVVIHSAAVSDYQTMGVYTVAPGTRFDDRDVTWHGAPPRLVDRTAAAKVKSDEPELWLRLERTPKLIDYVRSQWGFRGILVKFKLEVAVTEEELLAVAERSRRQSDGDYMVANTLEGTAEWAYLGSAAGYERINRPELAARLMDAIEKRFQERHNG